MGNDGPTIAVYIDGSAVNRFALLNVDPVKALASSLYRLMLTPNLAAEYRHALDHLFVPPYVKVLLRSLLVHAKMGPDAASQLMPKEPTDTTLAALSSTAIVITDDAGLARNGEAGMVVWATLETALRNGDTLADCLDGHARALREGGDDRR